MQNFRGTGAIAVQSILTWTLPKLTVHDTTAAHFITHRNGQISTRVTSS